MDTAKPTHGMKLVFLPSWSAFEFIDYTRSAICFKNDFSYCVTNQNSIWKALETTPEEGYIFVSNPVKNFGMIHKEAHKNCYIVLLLSSWFMAK